MTTANEMTLLIVTTFREVIEAPFLAADSFISNAITGTPVEFFMKDTPFKITPSHWYWLIISIVTFGLTFFRQQ